MHVYLKGLDAKAVLWGRLPLKQKLGPVCESHNFSVKQLWDTRFETNLIGEADLLLCAILLRLADILDFDNTRAPEEVYAYLGLSGRRTKRDATSDTEWQKHLAMEGFKFPPELGERYEIIATAAPDHPAVEHDVRQFLDTIETEMRQCSSLIPHCAPKWQKLNLPFSINRQFFSTGYRVRRAPLYARTGPDSRAVDRRKYLRRPVRSSSAS